ncbi:molybdenum storage protein subunit alpha [Actinomycetospora sp.]|uniref:amino acid kinase family protein n=1 Tax=Actinomycetospora sp. TaxID=1872135 RepID=UPI002F408EFE
MTAPETSEVRSKDVPSALMRQTLLDPERLAAAEPGRERPPRRLLPWLDVVVLGGSSVVDRGGDVLLGVVEELRSTFAGPAPVDGGTRLLILTGAGVRARHVLGVGLDLGLPAGALAGLAATEAEQNGHLVAALLAADGVSYLPHGSVARQLPVHLAAAPAAVSTGYPPYGVHEFPTAGGRLPVHRTDAGALLLADAFGARSLTYVRDTESLAGFEGAALTVGDATERAGGLPVDRVVLDLLPRAKHVRSLAVVDGTVRGRISDARAGRPSGLTLRAD